jgi:hypothetical protein
MNMYGNSEILMAVYYAGCNIRDITFWKCTERVARAKKEDHEECRRLECDAVWLLFDPPYRLQNKGRKNQWARNSWIASYC